jgi:hypothetical protein
MLKIFKAKLFNEMKVRYYVFMNPASSIAMEKIAKCIAQTIAVAKRARGEPPSRIWPKSLSALVSTFAPWHFTCDRGLHQ